MIIKKLIFSLCLLTSISIAACAQDDSIPLPTIILKTSKFTTNYPTEKVYVHFDKPYYAVGDTIWLKAYVTIEQHQLSALSRIVYVDLINSRDSIVNSLRLPVNTSGASGAIVLPQTSFNAGNYHVRAYTAWMRNFDPAYFFYKNITVGNAVDSSNPINTHIAFSNVVKPDGETIKAHVVFKDQDNIAYINRRVSWKVQSDEETIDKGKGTTDQDGGMDIVFSSNKPGIFATADLTTQLEVNYKKTLTSTFSLKTAAIAMDVQFLPEGGNLLSNVRSNVAFKAINSGGMGIDVSGTVVDNTNKVVASFKSRHLGMGSFYMIPEQGKTYKANVVFPDGSQSSYDLPRTLDEGIDLTLNNSNRDSLYLKITSNSDFLQKFAKTRLYIVGESGGVIYYAAQTNLSTLVYTAAIPKSKFPSGILQMSLLSSEGDPLSERLAFIQHNDLLNVTVSTDRPSYGARQKVKMGLLVRAKDIPVSGNFSLSVTDETKVPFDEDNETTILSSLLLSSELRGHIEKPNYYFNHVDTTRLANLDLLMLTQGYSKISYSDIIADKNPAIYFLPEQGINLSGILRTNTGIPVPHANIHLVIPDKIFSTDTKTDMSGVYHFTKLDLPDSAQVTISAKNNVDSKDLVVTVNNESIPTLLHNVNAPDNVVNIDSTLTTYLQNSKSQYSGTRVLKEVVIKAKSEVKKPSHADYPALTGLNPEPDHIVNSSAFESCADLMDCLKGSLFGFTYDNGNFYVSRDYNAGNKSTPAAIYFNGMAVDPAYLDNVQGSTIESVEVFLTDGLSGINKMDNTKGVIVINSKKIDKGEKISMTQFKDMLPKYNIVTISPQGFAKNKVFYVPKYTTAKTGMDLPDLRTTVYWNPQIITDNTGKASFEFYNSDNKGSYRAVLEGIDADGNLAHFVYHYKVE